MNIKNISYLYFFILLLLVITTEFSEWFSDTFFLPYYFNLLILVVFSLLSFSIPYSIFLRYRIIKNLTSKELIYYSFSLSFLYSIYLAINRYFESYIEPILLLKGIIIYFFALVCIGLIALYTVNKIIY